MLHFVMTYMIETKYVNKLSMHSMDWKSSLKNRSTVHTCVAFKLYL